MKNKVNNFLTVAKFELDYYFKSNSYIISTFLICALCICVMGFPKIKKMFTSHDINIEDTDNTDNLGQEKIALYDPNGIVSIDILSKYYVRDEIVEYDDIDELKKAVEFKEVIFGFCVNSETDFDYYVFNKNKGDGNVTVFSEYLKLQLKLNACIENGMDEAEFFALERIDINGNENILGKDSANNFYYCYILVVIIFMIIGFYGITISSSVTKEKSNRSIEILVTSTSSTALLFGKVIASSIASVFQVGVIGLSLFGSYNANKDYWSVDFARLLDIPDDVLITYAIFGIGGFLFYAFMYGALGALVSKTEDLTKSAGIAQMVVMVVYFVTLLQLFNIEGIIMKICSFLPISSYSAMFTRVAMGSVQTWEVVVSAIILYASVIGMGILGGKIFRNSTLRYGNPIKLTNAFKGLKKSE